MKKVLATLTSFALLFSINSEACTNVIVTKGASRDASNIISYAADSHWLYGELYFHKAARFKRRERMKSIGDMPVSDLSLR